MVDLLQISPGRIILAFLLRLIYRISNVTIWLTFFYIVYSFTEALDMVKEAINRTGYGSRIQLALDVAATDFCIGYFGTFLFQVYRKTVLTF